MIELASQNTQIPAKVHNVSVQRAARKKHTFQRKYHMKCNGTVTWFEPMSFPSVCFDRENNNKKLYAKTQTQIILKTIE